MTYELWDLTSRNLIDWFDNRAEALTAVRAYLDAGEADLVMLLVSDTEGQPAGTYTGRELVEWADASPSGARRSA